MKYNKYNISDKQCSNYFLDTSLTHKYIYTFTYTYPNRNTDPYIFYTNLFDIMLKISSTIKVYSSCVQCLNKKNKQFHTTKSRYHIHGFISTSKKIPDSFIHKILDNSTKFYLKLVEDDDYIPNYENYINSNHKFRLEFTAIL